VAHLGKIDLGRKSSLGPSVGEHACHEDEEKKKAGAPRSRDPGCRGKIVIPRHLDSKKERALSWGGGALRCLEEKRAIPRLRCSRRKTSICADKETEREPSSASLEKKKKSPKGARKWPQSSKKKKKASSRSASIIRTRDPSENGVFFCGRKKPCSLTRQRKKRSSPRHRRSKKEGGRDDSDARRKGGKAIALGCHEEYISGSNSVTREMSFPAEGRIDLRGEGRARLREGGFAVIGVVGGRPSLPLKRDSCRFHPQKKFGRHRASGKKKKKGSTLPLKGSAPPLASSAEGKKKPRRTPSNGTRRVREKGRKVTGSAFLFKKHTSASDSKGGKCCVDRESPEKDQ